MSASNPLPDAMSVIVTFAEFDVSTGKSRYEAWSVVLPKQVCEEFGSTVSEALMRGIDSRLHEYRQIGFSGIEIELITRSEE